MDFKVKTKSRKNLNKNKDNMKINENKNFYLILFWISWCASIQLLVLEAEQDIEALAILIEGKGDLT